MKVIPGRLVSRWRHYWMRRAGYAGFGRFAARLAALGTAPYHARLFLSSYSSRGFVSHTAALGHPRLKLGQRVYIGDNVVASAGPDAGEIELRSGFHEDPG